MRVWITCFLLLFGTAELLQWMQELTLPMPIFILGGAFLAIASNYEKLSNLPLHPDYEAPESKISPADPAQVAAGSAPPMGLPTQKRSAKPISFEIRKPFNPQD
jgi:hypothetical protein